MYYGVLPVKSPDSGCGVGCGVSADPVENIRAVASHELGGAITDPAAGGWSQPVIATVKAMIGGDDDVDRTPGTDPGG